MPLSVMVQVPLGDDTDLQALLQSTDSGSQLLEAHPFDGETVVQAVLVLVPTSLAALKTWIRSRADQRKSFKIAYRGMELSGYTPAEADQIIRTIEKDATASESGSQ